MLFNEAAWNYQVNHGSGDRLRALQNDFNAAHARERDGLRAWFAADHRGDAAAAQAARATAMDAYASGERARAQTRDVVRAGDPRVGNDADYMFITFIVRHLPHGIIGLLVAAFFAAALSSKAGELNALGATTTVDIYRHLARPDATDAHHVAASRWFTAGWGFVAIGFALSAQLAENLIQAVNILGSIFYGVVLGLFLVAFFLPRVAGTAVFLGGPGRAGVGDRRVRRAADFIPVVQRHRLRGVCVVEPDFPGDDFPPFSKSYP